MNEFFKRLQLPTPEFFQTIIKLGLMLGAIGTGLIAAPEAGIELPSWLLEIGKGMTTVGFVAALIAKSAVKDPTQINEKK